jgi:transaldolase
MKIFIQTGSSDDIRRVAEAGLLDGIVVSLTDLADQDPDVDVSTYIADLARAFAVPVCVPVAAVIGGDIYREGRELARISDQVIVQIPFVEDALVPIGKLVSDGVRVCATHVYSGAQAFLAGKIGALMVMAHVDEVDAHGQNSAQLVSNIRAVIDRAGLECDLFVSLPRSSTHFTECLLAGADTVCTTAEKLRELMIHTLTDRGVDRFLSDLSRRHKPRSI